MQRRVIQTRSKEEAPTDKLNNFKKTYWLTNESLLHAAFNIQGNFRAL